MLLLSQLFRFSGRLIYAGSWVSLWCPTSPVSASRQHGSTAGRPEGTAPGRAERGAVALSSATH